jgi:hypothetical protein
MKKEVFKKKCRACLEEKKLHEFGVNSSYKDGVSPRCKTCVNNNVKITASIVLPKRTFIDDEFLKCTSCACIKHKDAYYKDKTAPLGYEYKCKLCKNKASYEKQLEEFKKESAKIIDCLEGEVWKDIPDYEGYYMASNMGRLMSLPRLVDNKFGTKHLVRKKILSAEPRTFGYVSAVLRKEGVGISYRVHRLIIKTFLGESDLVVDHINGIRHDNRLENLRYCTHRENSKYSSEKMETLSKYVGVSYIKNGCKWVASISIKGKGYTVGLFETEIEAHNAYQKALYEWETFKKIPDYKVHTPYSSCKGVSYHIGNNKWECSITINKTRYNLGSYLTEEEACQARSEVETNYKEYNILPHYVNPKLTSNYKYVHWKESNRKWQITLPKTGNSPKKYGGVFETEEGAMEAVLKFLKDNNSSVDIKR